MQIIHVNEGPLLFNTIPDYNDALSILANITLMKHKVAICEWLQMQSLISTTGFLNLYHGGKHS
jgi:hypothetical protein